MQFQTPNQLQQRPQRTLMTFKQFLSSEQAKAVRSSNYEASSEKINDADEMSRSE